MGYYLFRVDFRNRKSWTVATGGAVDFIPMPEGATSDDVVVVHPHANRADPSELPQRYYWSIYEGVVTS